MSKIRLAEDLYRGDITELEFVVVAPLGDTEVEMRVLSQHDTNGVRMLKLREHGSDEMLYSEEYWAKHYSHRDFDEDLLEDIIDIAIDLL